MTKKVSALTIHPLLLQTFTAGTAEERAALEEDVRLHGIQRPLTVTGAGCASPPGTVLGGRRRLAAGAAVGVTDVPVVELTDLSADDEAHAIIRENLADQLGRRLLASDRARLEKILIDRYARPSGHRSDLGTSSGSRQGRTTDIVAEETGESRNSVVDRQTVFFSPASPAALQKAVDRGQLAQTVAANMVRAASRNTTFQQALTSGLTDPDHPAIAGARQQVEEALKARLGRSGEPKPPLAPLSTSITVGADGRATAILRGRAVAVAAPPGTRVELSDLGPATKAQTAGEDQRPAVSTSRGLTPQNWQEVALASLVEWSDELEGVALNENTVRLTRPGLAGSVTLKWWNRTAEWHKHPELKGGENDRPVIHFVCEIGRLHFASEKLYVVGNKCGEQVERLRALIKGALTMEGLLGDGPPRRWDPQADRIVVVTSAVTDALNDNSNEVDEEAELRAFLVEEPAGAADADEGATPAGSDVEAGAGDTLEDAAAPKDVDATSETKAVAAEDPIAGETGVAEVESTDACVLGAVDEGSTLESEGLPAIESVNVPSAPAPVVVAADERPVEPEVPTDLASWREPIRAALTAGARDAVSSWADVGNEEEDDPDFNLATDGSSAMASVTFEHLHLPEDVPSGEHPLATDQHPVRGELYDAILRTGWTYWSPDDAENVAEATMQAMPWTDLADLCVREHGVHEAPAQVAAVAPKKNVRKPRQKPAGAPAKPKLAKAKPATGSNRSPRSAP
jgi:hypothetical protein